MENALMRKIQNGGKALGTFLSLDSVPAIEGLGKTGLDFVIADCEHGPVGIDTLTSYIRAAEIAGLTPMVRVYGAERGEVLHALDVGAQALIVPNIKGIDDVRRLINYAKFAPLGDRGFCPTRDGRWGFEEFASHGYTQYMEYCNRETQLIPQCETMGCLNDIERIAALDGVDGIYVGPCDLSISMGIPGEFDNPRLKEAIRRILRACRDNGKQAHIFAGSEEMARECFDMGFDAVTYSLDAIVYIKAFKSAVEAILK